MLENASNAKKILMLFMSENAKNYAGLFYRWLGGGHSTIIVECPGVLLLGGGHSTMVHRPWPAALRARARRAHMHAEEG